MKAKDSNEQFIGIVSGAGAYLLWGILPVYWKMLHRASPLEILAHRVIWSLGFMLLVLAAARKMAPFWGELRDILLQPKRVAGVTIASLVLSVNWLTYIWAVNNNHVIETSLGYYINPLVNVLLGIVVLKERLSFWQIFSFCLAMVGVLNMTLHFGSVPWAALILAVSFGLYGLLKKMVNLSAMTGLTLETLIISPLALLYVGWIQKSGSGSFGLSSPDISVLLMGAGVVTAIPLLLFAAGANRLPLSIVGFLQYISPTITLVLGVLLFHEPFTAVHLVSFVFIWAALVIFSLARTRVFVQLEYLLKNINLKARGTEGK